MKYLHLPLDISAAALPYVEQGLRYVLENFPQGIPAEVYVEMENLTNELRAAQQRFLAEARKR